MFPDSSILGFSDSRAFTLKGYPDSQQFTQVNISGNIHDGMVTKLFLASFDKVKKMPPRKKARVDSDATEANLNWTDDEVELLLGVVCAYCVVPENIHTPPTEGFSSLTPHPPGFSVPEGLAVLPPTPRKFHDFAT